MPSSDSTTTVAATSTQPPHQHCSPSANTAPTPPPPPSAPTAAAEPPTRIPQPTPPPSPLRRSLSLRTRTDSAHPISTDDADEHHSLPVETTTGVPSAVAAVDEREESENSGRTDAGGRIGQPDDHPWHTTDSMSSSASTPKRNASTTARRLPTSKSLSAIGGTALGMAQKNCIGGQQQQQSQSVSGAAPNHQRYGRDTVPNGGHRHHHGMSLDLTPNSADHDAPTARQPSRRASSAHRTYAHAATHVQSPLTPRGGPHTVPPTRLTPKTPPVSPDDPLTGYHHDDDDADSMYSYTSVASGRSTMSCDHPCVARNGTTFSGRKMKYVVHCSSHAGQTGDDYLTPTQRAQKHIRRLKMLLSQAHMDLEQRDSEILRLTKEVVELRLFKASLSSPDDRSNSSDAVTVRENDPKTSTDVSPIVVDADDDDDDDDDETDARMSKSLSPGNHRKLPPYPGAFADKMLAASSEMHSSFADSGHFEDLTTSSVHSKDSYAQTTSTSPLHHDDGANSSRSPSGAAGYDDHGDLIKFYEAKIEDLIRNHNDESQEVKVTHNDRVEALLQKLAECNTRYADMVPDHEQARERIRELEKQLEELHLKLQEQDNKQNKMYLHMFTKGQEAERIEQADKVMEIAASCSASTSGPAVARVSVPELMQQLQVTQNELENIKDTNYVQERGSAQALLSAKEAISLWLLGARKTMYRRLIEAQQSQNRVDPEVTLQFLKSAVYYFLTDKENTKGHLNAIESILGFSDKEKRCIDRVRSSK